MNNDKVHNFKLLSGKDIGSLEINIADAAKMVEKAIAAIGTGESIYPTKISICRVPEMASYALLGESCIDKTIGMKNYFRHTNKDGLNKSYWFVSLFDTDTGTPLALMDGRFIDGLRNSLVSALFAKNCAKTDAKSLLVIGSGYQGQMAIPGMLECNPNIENIAIFGHYDDSISKIITTAKSKYPTKNIFRADNLKTAVENSDIILGVTGETSIDLAQEKWIKPGTLMILLGYGIEAAAAAHKADRVITTSTSQMKLTGTDLLDEKGNLPNVTAELHEVLLKQKPGRTNDLERIFAYNSGLVVADIALAKVFYEQAKQLNIGTEIELW